jgi:hypothetical protein
LAPAALDEETQKVFLALSFGRSEVGAAAAAT